MIVYMEYSNDDDTTKIDEMHAKCTKYTMLSPDIISECSLCELILIKAKFMAVFELRYDCARNCIRFKATAFY